MHEMIGKKAHAHRWRDNSCRSPNGPMSALGQKPTYALQKGMSALPLMTAKADSRKRSCPLYPQKRTNLGGNVVSALGREEAFPLGCLVDRHQKILRCWS